MKTITSAIQEITRTTNLSAQEAWWLLEHITNKKKEALMVNNSLSNQEHQDLLASIVKLTDQHMPLAYILGFVPFIDLRIKVQAPILIPRPETEEWVYNLINTIKNNHHEHKILTILDIGTGSGCIALALAKHFPHAKITAIDINPQALILAQYNALLNNISNVTFIKSDLFSAIPTDMRFDLIVSNPPYIDPNASNTLSAQVMNWEDPTALFAQDKGLAIIDKILHRAHEFLQPSRTLPFQLIIEIDQYHKDNALSCAQSYTWSAQAHKDSFGNWRTIWCKKT